MLQWRQLTPFLYSYILIVIMNVISCEPLAAEGEWLDSETPSRHIKKNHFISFLYSFHRINIDNEKLMI